MTIRPAHGSQSVSAGVAGVVPAVATDDLTKEIGGRRVVDGLSIAVAAGEVFGFLGPNGAGKTTTIRMLLGLARPTAGTARLLGEPVPPSPAVLRRVGAIVEEPVAYPWLSGGRFLRILLDAGPREPEPEALVESALARVGLTDAGRRKVATYSQGMRQRLGLAAALVRKPKLLVLDEPANGLDPAGIVEFRSLFRELAAGGATVFLSSHQLGEVARVCDRVAVIDHGQLVETLTLRAADRARPVHVRLRAVDVERARDALEAWSPRRYGDAELVVDGVDGRAVAEVLARADVFPEALTDGVSSLERRFLGLTGSEPTG